MTILFIHGYGATPDMDFYPALRPLLDQAGILYCIPSLPNARHPQKEQWLDTIKSTFDGIDDQVILVGHSLGTRAALLFLEKYPVQVAGAILIAAFANRLENGNRRHAVYSSFFDHLIDIDLVKSRCPRFLVMHSRNDASIPFEQGQEIAEDLGAELLQYQTNDHFNEPRNAQEIFTVITRLVAGKSG